jgi:hypothetical protein
MYTPVQPENLTKSYHGRSAPAADDASSRIDANQAAAIIKPLRSSTSAPLNLTVAAQITSGTPAQRRVQHRSLPGCLVSADAPGLDEDEMMALFISAPRDFFNRCGGSADRGGETENVA